MQIGLAPRVSGEVKALDQQELKASLVQCVEACTELLREELQLSQQIYTYYINHPLEKNQAI